MPAAVEPGAAPTPAPERVASGKALPRLVDLGADKCQACKMMMPVLDGLKKDHADAFVTEFIDVWENPEEAKKYNVRLIPTQVFLDASGGELFRHEGFFGKDDILAKWQELGVELGAGEQSE
ncbi:MAG: thioredoxin family protein [Lentisphaerae bacterium]|nr:thioredoxin family protein [Lentisphaerota bacterium]